MSHSTHVGFNEPPTCSLSGRLLPCVPIEPDFQSRLVGVAHFTAASKPICLPSSRRRAVLAIVPRGRLSLAPGVGHSRAATVNGVPKLLPFFTRSLVAWCRASQVSSGSVRLCRLLVGVGHDPDPVPAVRSANGGSGNTVPLRIVPDRSERPEHLVQSARAKGCDVFGDDPARARFGDDAVHFPPEAASLSRQSGAFAGEADVLAGKPAGDDVGPDSGGSESGCGDAVDIAEVRDTGKPRSQDGRAIRVDFTEPGDGEAGALEAKLESADAAEQAEDIHYSPTAFR